MLRRSLLTIVLLSGLAQSMNLNAASPVPPIALKVPKIIETHGDKRVDDYFWLREKTNAQVLAYLEKENAGASQVKLTPADLKQIEEASPKGAVAGQRYPEEMMRMVGR